MTRQDYVGQALATRFAKPEYLLWFEVRDGGLHGKRTADALALNVWEGRGQELHGFEIKVSRSDWLRERKQPAKAESIQRFCDRWWLVTGGEKDFVKDGELPAPWGHIHVTPDGKSRVVKVAPKTERHPWSHTFIVQLLRAVDQTYEHGWIPCEQIAAELEKARKQGEEHINYQAKNELERLRTQVETSRKVMEAIGISSYELSRHGLDPERVGKIVRLMIHHQLDPGASYPGSLEQARNCAERFLEDVESALDLLKTPLCEPAQPPVDTRTCSEVEGLDVVC